MLTLAFYYNKININSKSLDLTRKILRLKPLSMPGALMGSWPDKGLTG